MATILDVPNDVWLIITQFANGPLARWYELRRVCKSFQQRLRSALCNFQVTLDRPVLVANLEPGVRHLTLVRCDGPSLRCISHLHLHELSLAPDVDLLWDALIPLKSLRTLRIVYASRGFAIKSSDLLCLPELRSLTLANCTFAKGSISQLQRVHALKHLALSHCKLDEARFNELASLTMLQELDLSGLYMPHMSRLSRLPLRHLSVTDSFWHDVDEILLMCNTDTLESLTVSHVEVMNQRFTSNFKKLSTITIQYAESHNLVMRLDRFGIWCVAANSDLSGL